MRQQSTRAVIDAIIVEACATGYAGEFEPPLVEALHAIADRLDHAAGHSQTDPGPILADLVTASAEQLRNQVADQVEQSQQTFTDRLNDLIKSEVATALELARIAKEPTPVAGAAQVDGSVATDPVQQPAADPVADAPADGTAKATTEGEGGPAAA